VKRLFVVVSSALLACLVAGLVVGGVARVLMRLVSLAAGDDSGFSVGGTIAIMLAYATFMLPGALAPGRARTVLLVLGALVLCVPAASIAGQEVDGTAGLSALQWAGVLVAGAAIFATIGVLPVVTKRVAEGLRSRWAT
jgi:hypothetical protein